MSIADDERPHAVVPASNTPVRTSEENGYYDPTLALPRAWWFATLQWIVVLVAAGGDAANFYLALATVEKHLTTYMVVAVVGALTVAAVAIMYAVGVSARDFKARQRLVREAAEPTEDVSPVVHDRPPRPKSSSRGGIASWYLRRLWHWGLWRKAGLVQFAQRSWKTLRPAMGLVTLTVLWASLGVASFVLRLAGTGTGSDTGGFAFAGAEQPQSMEGRDKLLLALMMLALYLATGALAAWFAYHHHNPYYAAAKRARKKIKRVNKQIAALEVAEVRYEEQIKLLEQEKDREAERRLNELALCTAQSKELKALARADMVTHLRDPAATSALTNTELPPPSTVPEPTPR